MRLDSPKRSLCGGATLQRLIPSLAILKVNWDAGRDYIDNFVPFVAECLRTAPQPEVSLPELQAAIRQAFDLDIPQAPLRTILRRAARRGYVRQTEGIYRRDDAALAGLNFPRIRDDVLRKYEALIRKLIEFCKRRFDVEWTAEEADAALLACLEETSPAILGAAVDGRVIPVPKVPVAHADFFVRSFVVEMHESDPDGFEFLETVVKGSMLAAVLWFPDMGGVERRFDGVEVYFDTGFVLQALGLEGDSKRAPRVELIQLLYEEGANLRIFEHTLGEVQNVLSAAAYALRNYAGLRGAYGPTLQYLIDAAYTASDVQLVIGRLEPSLRGLHVQTKPKPPHSKRLGVDEVRLQSILREEMQYPRQETLNHDVDSLTAIHRLRRGQAHLHIESCDAIFVTTNNLLGRACARFFREEYEEYRDSVVPHCTPDHVFTTIVWLKRPLRAPDLPRKRMIADCYAALNPPDSLWKKYLEEIDRLQQRGNISKEEYDLLRFSLPARDALMEATFGAVGAFTEGTVAEVLERAKAAVRAGTEAALEAERKARIDAEREAEAARRGEREARLGLEAQRQARLDRVRAIGARVGRWVALLGWAAGALLLATATFLSLFFPGLPGGVWMPLVAAILVPTATLAMANVAVGATLTSVTRRVEVGVAGFVERTLNRLLQP